MSTIFKFDQGQEGLRSRSSRVMIPGRPPKGMDPPRYTHVLILPNSQKRAGDPTVDRPEHGSPENSIASTSRKDSSTRVTPYGRTPQKWRPPVRRVLDSRSRSERRGWWHTFDRLRQTFDREEIHGRPPEQTFDQKEIHGRPPLLCLHEVSTHYKRRQSLVWNFTSSQIFKA